MLMAIYFPKPASSTKKLNILPSYNSNPHCPARKRGRNPDDGINRKLHRSPGSNLGCDSICRKLVSCTPQFKTIRGRLHRVVPGLISSLNLSIAPP